MAWRKWLVRSLVFTLAAVAAAGGLAYQHWANPEAIRQQVIARMGVYLPGATVSLESGRLSIFGGISVRDLRLVRRDDPNKADFAVFPTGTIYHDKQQLLNRVLAIRKLEFHGVKLRIQRRRDGSWNLANILATPDLSVQVPTIVFHDSTFVLEDRCAALPPLEIRNVHFSVVNDPHDPPGVSTLTYEMTGVTDLAGIIHVSGTWSRKTDELTCSLQLPSFHVDGSLVERLSAYFPEAAVHARELTGVGNIRLDLNYQPQAVKKWSYEVHGNLAKGKLRHARLPFPLEKLEAKVRVVDGRITVEQITATSGATRFTVKNTTLDPESNWDLDGFIEAQHLPLSKELFSLPATFLKDLQHDYQPSGLISLSMSFSRRGDNWQHVCTVHPENMAVVFAKFRYPIHDITGEIKHEADDIKPYHPPSRLTLKVTGYAGLRPVSLEGEALGKGPLAPIDLKIWGKDIVIDETLRNALPQEYPKLFDTFSPRGLVDFEAYIRQKPGELRSRRQYLARIHDASCRYAMFPYPLEEVRGLIDIQNDHFEFRDFHGRHKGGEFYSHGGSDPATKKITIEVTGAQVLLDDEMDAALVEQPSLQRTWRKLAPSGRMSFEAHVEQAHVEQPQQTPEPSIAVLVHPLGCRLVPEFFRYAIEDLRGVIQYRRGEVLLKNISARHGPTLLGLKDGQAILEANGNIWIKLVELVGNPIVPDAELFRALPKLLGETCARLQLKEPLALRTDMTLYLPADGSPPYIYWDGDLWLKGATLATGVKMEQVTGVISCRGEHQGRFGKVRGNLWLDHAVVYNQLLSDIHSEIVVTEKNPDALDLPNLRAKLYGGNLGGEVHLVFSPTFGFQVNLSASQVMLEEFARRNNITPKARLSGLAQARLYLRGTGTESKGLEGNGSIDVPSGKMGYDLPLLLDLVKVLSLRLPDKTAFEEAHIRFSVRGPLVEFSELNLFGNSISLKGAGTMKLDGSDLNLDFIPVWSRITQLSPPLLDQIPPLISKQLLKIKMRGSIGDVKCEKEVVPPVTEPLKKLLNRLGGGD